MKKMKTKMKMKWVKAIWNDIKRFVAEYGIPIVLVLGICILGSVAKSKILEKQEEIEILKEENQRLENELNNAIQENRHIGEAYDELVEENQLFGSMLGQIEYEEGGHEILKKLYDEYSK